MSEERSEKIEFQRIMNYKAYRRKMIAVRAGLTVIVAGGLCAFCIKSVTLGIILAVIALCAGAITIIAALGNEQTYTVYNTRIVLKKRGDDKRVSVALDSVKRVKLRSAFYEKGLATGTVTIFAINEKGKTKRYRMRYIFDAKPVVDYIAQAIEQKGKTQNEA